MLGEMDEYCNNIFWFMWINEQKMRFNELYRGLNETNVRVSKPTLITHLGHLQKLGLIIRRQEDKQNVTYEINWEHLKHIKENLRYKDPILAIEKNKEMFESFSPRDQLLKLLDILLLNEFHAVKLGMADVLEPEKKLDHNLAFWLISKTLNLYLTWFLITFKKSDEETQKMLLEKVNGSIGLLNKDIFATEKIDN